MLDDGESMIRNKFLRVISFFAISAFVIGAEISAQEKLTVSYSSVDAPSANWYIAQEKGLYKNTAWMSNRFLFRLRLPTLPF
jgi:ABC-type nitrate/sulfonate/bicarbonate transport system substrate-binding protein